MYIIYMGVYIYIYIYIIWRLGVAGEQARKTPKGAERMQKELPEKTQAKPEMGVAFFQNTGNSPRFPLVVFGRCFA